MTTADRIAIRAVLDDIYRKEKETYQSFRPNHRPEGLLFPHLEVLRRSIQNKPIPFPSAGTDEEVATLTRCMKDIMNSAALTDHDIIACSNLLERVKAGGDPKELKELLMIRMRNILSEQRLNKYT
jgi:hypothetical protein